MKKYLLILIPVFVLFYSCEKEAINPAGKDMIVVGDNADMIINNYDTIMMYAVNTYSIDVNNDSINDYKFIIDDHPIKNTICPKMEIGCLTPDAMLEGYLERDTTYLHIEKIDRGDNRFIYYNMYSCHKVTDHDEISAISPEKLHIMPRYKKDNIYLTNYFECDTTILINYSGSVGKPGSYDDVFDYTCKNLPFYEYWYLGIKVRKNNSDKLGWIKLAVINADAPSAYKLAVIESAIQK